MKKISFGLLGLALMSVVPGQAQEAPAGEKAPAVRYSVTDLGTLGGKYSLANAINNKGEIAGQASNKDGQSRAVKWVDGKIIDCGVGEGFSNALDINENGFMVGYSGKTFGTSSQAFYWDAANKSHTIMLTDDFKKEGGSALRTINNKNQIGGYANDMADGEEAGNAQGFLMSLGEVITVVPLKGDDVNIIPNGLNDAGEIVMTVSYNGKQVGWKYKKALPMEVEGSVQLLDINEKGQVAVCLGGGKAARLETEGDQIGLLEYGAGLPVRINVDGVMVGVGEGGATLFENREAIDLNTLIPADSGWKLSSAGGINDKGQIVGFGSYKDSDMRAYLLTPVK